MVFKNIHSLITAGLWWKWSVLSFCLVLLALWWDSGLDSVCLCLCSPLPFLGSLSLARADLQRLTGAKRSARDIDLTRSFHHTLIYVIITAIAKLGFSNTVYSTVKLQQTFQHWRTRALTHNNVNNCFCFGVSTLWSTSAAWVAPKVVLGNNNNESCSNKSLIHSM